MTKTLKFSAFALLSVLILWACGGENLTAKQTGEKFLKAMKANDFSTAKDYATKKAGESIDLMASSQKGQPGGDPSTIVVGEVEENGDKAVLSYTDEGKAKTLELIKEGGEWKAVWSKTDTGGSAIDGAIDGAARNLEGAFEDALKDLGGDSEDHEGHDH